MDLHLEDITGSGSGEWLADALCTTARDPGGVPLALDAFFVEAGHIIDPDVLDLCRRCPVRADCLRYAYTRGIGAGYFGGLSPGQRRTMDVDEALAFIATDPARR